MTKLNYTLLVLFIIASFIGVVRYGYLFINAEDGKGQSFGVLAGICIIAFFLMVMALRDGKRTN